MRQPEINLGQGETSLRQPETSLRQDETSLRQGEIIETLKQINDYIDYTELSMAYFDGCDQVKLKAILDKLFNQGLVEVHPLDERQYRVIGGDENA